MKEIKRDGYLNMLISRRRNGMIKVITGIRRCGKTYLLFRLYRNWLLGQGIDRDHIIEIPLDDDDFEDLRDRKALRQFIKDAVKDDEVYYVLLDEVQFCEGFEGVLNGLARKENLDLYVTGSNSRFLSSDVLTEFRGRGDEIRVYPLSFSEFAAAYDGTKEEAWSEYMMYGGMPQILSYDTDADKSKYLKDLFSKTYLKDVLERNQLKSDTVMEEVVNVLASSVGSLTNPNKMANTFVSEGVKTNDKTVSSYVDHLMDAFIIEKVERYDVKGRKYIGTPLKYYFADIGLRNARLNFRQQEPTHLMENIIYNELLVRRYNVDVGVVTRYQRDETGKQIVTKLEIDFVCNLGHQRYYIQSAYSLPDAEKMAQETASLDRVDDSYKKIIVVGDPTKPWHTEKGYLVMNIIDFLLDQDSLNR